MIFTWKVIRLLKNTKENWNTWRYIEIYEIEGISLKKQNKCNFNQNPDTVFHGTWEAGFKFFYERDKMLLKKKNSVTGLGTSKFNYRRWGISLGKRQTGPYDRIAKTKIDSYK